MIDVHNNSSQPNNNKVVVHIGGKHSLLIEQGKIFDHIYDHILHMFHQNIN